MLRMTVPQVCALLVCLVGLVAGLLAQSPISSAPASSPASNPATTTVPASRPVIVSSPFRWRLMPDAFGSCEGIVFHPADASIRYAYSGDAGASRWDWAGQRWTGMSDWNRTATFGKVWGIAVDPTDRDTVYYVAGEPRAEIFASFDGGQTFLPSDLADPEGRPTFAGGPAGAGSRLNVDPNNPNVLYYASRLGGLWRSLRASTPGSWKAVDSFTIHGDTSPAQLQGERRNLPPDGGLAFVAVDAGGGTLEVQGIKRSRVLYVGVVGDRRVLQDSPREPIKRLIEGGVWRSSDGGESWALLGGPIGSDSRATTAVVSADGELWALVKGRVMKARRGSRRMVDAGAPAGVAFANLAIDPVNPSHLIAAAANDVMELPAPGTQPSSRPSTRSATQSAAQLYRTTDGGGTWSAVGSEFLLPPWTASSPGAPLALKFEPNAPKDAGGRSKTLWIGNAAGVWVCNDLDAPLTHWKHVARGRGGLDVTNIASPPLTDAGHSSAVIATCSQLGGFRYTGSTATPTKTLAALIDGTRSPTTAPIAPSSVGGWNVSFCETDARYAAAAGTWGLALSIDGGESWTLADLRSLSVQNGTRLPDLHVAVGSASLGAFPSLVLLIDGQIPHCSVDGGKSWISSKGLPVWRAPARNSPARSLAADPLDPKAFYFFSDNLDGTGMGRLLVSTDAGVTWTPGATIPYASRFRPVGDHQLIATPGRGGDLWLCVAEAYSPRLNADADGLYHSTDGGKSWTKSPGWTRAYSVAFGAGAPTSPKSPSMVIAGEYEAEEGVYLTDDPQTSAQNQLETNWRKIWEPDTTDTPAIAFGLRCIAADRRVYGRVYVGSNGVGRGLFFGEPVATEAPVAPSDVRARRTPTGVVVEWTDPVGAAEYDVQRRTEPVGEWQTIALAAWQARIIDTSAEAGQHYRYRVIASNAFGRSEPRETALPGRGR